jgi:two-component system sensor histidine kinase RstB
MKNIFFRIYGCITIVALLLTLAAYLVLGSINKSRFERYVIENVGGTFSLMVAGIVRHKTDKRKQWIEVVERLTGISLHVAPLIRSEGYNRLTLGQAEQVIYINSDPGGKSAKIALPLSASSDEFVHMTIDSLNQTMGRVTALLILNELGRHPRKERHQVLNTLDDNFSYSLNLLNRDVLQLDESQWRQLRRGDIVSSFNDAASGDPVINVYAKYGNSGRYLRLGPMQTFQWYPISIVLPLSLLVALMLLVTGYLLLHPLEKKLRMLEQGINNAGTSQAKPIVLVGRDGLTRMADSVNKMVQRIDSLVGQQRQLTNDISHELRTPVARMMFRIENLIDQKLDDKDENIIGLKKDVGTISEMIDEILTGAKLDHQKHIVISTFDLRTEVIDMVEDLSIHYPQCAISTELGLGGFIVEADKMLLLRAIRNLLSNACRYCESQVKISLFSRKSPLLLEKFEIRVEDDGPGVPLDYREQIFNPFVRIDESRNRSSGGFGLGLSIVHKIVDLHDGEISVGSSEQLSGALFKVALNRRVGLDLS